MKAATFSLILPLIVVHVCISRFPVTQGAEESVSVTTTLGEVEGLLLQRDGQPVSVFRGIPFAEPPVKDLRFKKPVAKTSWSPGLLKAKQQKPVCPQPVVSVMRSFFNQSEDCLFLNIYVPLNLSSRTSSPGNQGQQEQQQQKASVLLPTMVWIHGGAFMAGAGETDGSMLAIRGQVIVVTVSYRLTVLGFLHTTDPINAPGNAGLHDQVLALKFVRQHILSFSGNPEEVTIFGNSAGAISVSWHLLYPSYSSSGETLFKRAIMQSGGPTTLLTAGSEAGPFGAEEIAVRLNCSYIGKAVNQTLYPTFTEETFACLRAVSVQQLISTAQAVTYQGKAYGFTPTLDSEFFRSEHPMDRLKSGNESYSPFDARHREILIGTNSMEGAVAMTLLLPDIFPLYSDVPVNLSWPMVERALSQKKAGSERGLHSVMDMTIGTERDFAPPDQIIRQANDMISEVGFFCPTFQLIEAFAARPVAGGQGRKVFHYRLEARMSVSNGRKRVYPWAEEAVHEEEIAMIFGEPFSRPDHHTDQDRELSDRIIRYWTTFAKTGSPTGVNETGQWPPSCDTDDGEIVRKYKVFHVNHTDSVSDGLPLNQCDRWEAGTESIRESTRVQDL